MTFENHPKFKFQVSLEDSHAHLFTYGVWWLSCYGGKVVTEMAWPRKPKILPCGPL